MGHEGPPAPFLNVIHWAPLGYQPKGDSISPVRAFYVDVDRHLVDGAGPPLRSLNCRRCSLLDRTRSKGSQVLPSHVDGPGFRYGVWLACR
jgi:hypothetical protein